MANHWQSMMRPARAGMVMVALGAILTGCGSSGSSASSPSSAASPSNTAQPAEPGYRLYVMPDTWDTLNLGYTYAKAWPVVSKLGLSTALVVITEDDIASYDWADQRLTLTADGAERLLAPRGFGLWLSHNCFVVTLNGERQYGGIFIRETSAIGIEFPVIYSSRYDSLEGAVSLLIRPAILGEPVPYSLIDIPAIRDRFAALGKLASPTPPSSAATEPTSD